MVDFPSGPDDAQVQETARRFSIGLSQSSRVAKRKCLLLGRALQTRPSVADTQASAAWARAVVMQIERRLGFDPGNRAFEKLSYDNESRGRAVPLSQTPCRRERRLAVK